MSVEQENPAPLILIVDDDIEIRDLLTRYLNEQGYATHAVGDGKEMDQWLQAKHPDLIIMDLMLPGEDGLSLTQRIKSSTNLPIIMLTARGDEIDRIIGLELGADDYLPKPFNPRELLARIKAVLRRGISPASKTAVTQDNIIQFNDFTLDTNRMKLHKNGHEIPITTGEMDLLIVLAQNPGKVLSRDQLMNRLKGSDRDPFDRSIDVRVTRLRSKIEETPASPQLIHTVWGKGYRFTPNETT